MLLDEITGTLNASVGFKPDQHYHCGFNLYFTATQLRYWYIDRIIYRNSTQFAAPQVQITAVPQFSIVSAEQFSL